MVKPVWESQAQMNVPCVNGGPLSTGGLTGLPPTGTPTSLDREVSFVEVLLFDDSDDITSLPN